MSIVVSGSLAYDYTMHVPDRFQHHILPDQLHTLNVCFIASTLRRHFGGCAGNIAYTMQRLGVRPVVLSALGSDSAEYLAHLERAGIGARYIAIAPDALTASAYITTDRDGNQIVTYYGGAGDASATPRIADVRETPTLAIIAPTNKAVMLQHAKECTETGVPYALDPSHQLAEVIAHAQCFLGNDYEMHLAMRTLRWSREQLRSRVPVLVTTLDAQGSRIETAQGSIMVGVCPVRDVADPTGAGDAYRGGFFAAYAQGKDLETCGRVGAVAAAYTVERHGTQTHAFTMQEFAQRYADAFGVALQLDRITAQQHPLCRRSTR